MASVQSASGAPVTITTYQRKARRTWRERRRAAGLSWSCVIGNHAVCSGLVGRLQEIGVLRPACPCPCHEDEAFQQELEDKLWDA